MSNTEEDRGQTSSLPIVEARYLGSLHFVQFIFSFISLIPRSAVGID